MARLKGGHQVVHFLRTNYLAIKFQLMLFICSAHIHHPYKQYYKRIYSTSSSRHNEAELVSVGHGTLQARDEQKSRLAEGWCPSLKVSKRLEQHGSRGNIFAVADDLHQWDWRGLPDKWAFFRLYELVSLSWMIYACLRTTFKSVLFPWFDWLLGSRIGLPAHCVFMGRFVLHPTVDHMGPLIFSSFHLIWRAVQHFFGRRYMLGPVTFLLQSEHDISQFLELMERNESGLYLSKSSEPPAVDSDGISSSVALMSHRFRRYRELYTRDSLGGDGPAAAAAANTASSALSGPREQQQQKPDLQISVHEHFMRHLMCFEVHCEQGVRYKLRPNRTLAARNTMTEHLSHSCLLSGIALVVLAVPITLAIFLIVLSDFRYAQIYPGCFAELDRLFAAGELDFWSQTITRHHLAICFFDTIENLVIWLDSGLAITFVVALTYFMNCDLLFYWHHLHHRLETSYRRMRGFYVLKEYVQQAQRSMPNNMRNPLERLVEMEASQLSALINEIQFQYFDFFRQVEHADLLVSDILTAAILIWLSCCAFVGFCYLSSSHSEMPLIIKVVQLLGVFVITLATKYLLQLRQCCLQSYKLICSLMAHEQAHKTKRQFIKVLEFFSERNRTTYTLFHHYPYLATTYIALIGWTFSCFAIAYALFGRDQAKGQLDIRGKHHYFNF